MSTKHAPEGTWHGTDYLGATGNLIARVTRLDITGVRWWFHNRVTGANGERATREDARRARLGRRGGTEADLRRMDLIDTELRSFAHDLEREISGTEARQ